MPSRSQVLVVDRQTDMRDVLRAVLEPRGVSVDRVTPGEAAHLNTAHGNPAASETQTAPQLLVIDADASTAAVSAMQRWPQVPCIVVGRFELPSRTAANRATTAVADPAAVTDRNTRRLHRVDTPAEHSAELPAARAVLAKPFAYGELIQRILEIIPAE